MTLQIESFIHTLLNDSPKYSDTKNLNRYEHRVFSQNGEDGIISEIFKRIGVTNKFFVEFGVDANIENNTTALLLKNWSGQWFDVDEKHISTIMQNFHSIIEGGKLSVNKECITPDNIESLFDKYSIPTELDLLSIDIDGNDYWVWKALEKYRPRVVVIEYNALYTPDINCVIKYNPDHRWDGTTYFGASLKALERMGAKKGYKLVGCELRGINAFFVREDLVDKLFSEPYTAENHYEPIRYFLIPLSGVKRAFGDFIIGD